MELKILLLDDNIKKEWQNAIKKELEAYNWYFYTYPKKSENILNEESIKRSIGRRIKTTDEKVFVLMDYQLATNWDNTPQQNENFRNWTLNALKSKENAYLFLYSSVEPNALSNFHDRVKKEKKDENWKCKLYYQPITLYINKPPYNLGSFLSNRLTNEIDRIKANNYSNWF